MVEWLYDIAEAPSLEELATTVNESGHTGWEPSGGITEITENGRIKYVQALKKPKNGDRLLHMAGVLQQISDKMNIICVAIED